MRAAPCCRWRCTTTADRRRCATSPSAPALPQPYLEQILLALKGAGLVRSKRGVGGGYVLARPPDQIRLAEIVSAVDGPITLGDFGEPHQDGACDHEGQCVLLAVWKQAGDATCGATSRATRSPSIAEVAHGDGPVARHRLRARSAALSSASARRAPASIAREVGGRARLRNSSRSPVTGWSNASSAACRNGRSRPSVGRRWP